MKCLPQSKISQANGNILHDWHAEVLAIRGFNRWLVEECAELARGGFGSEGAWMKWMERGQESSKEERTGVDTAWTGQPFALNDDVRIHMYCSEAPCGDASMELTMAAQEDATPWATPNPPTSDKSTLLGRGHFDQLGIVRRKPSRPDAPPCLSKSCTDKIALKQLTSLLSSLTSLLIHPGNVYVSQLILPESECVPKAIERAFSRTGRLASLTHTAKRGGYAFNPFTTTTTSREFAFSRRDPENSPVPSNISALWTPHDQAVLINGVLQGRKQSDPKGACSVSRRRVWERVKELAGMTSAGELAAMLSNTSYAGLKESALLRGRQAIKLEARDKALHGWVRNEGDEEWGLV